MPIKTQERIKQTAEIFTPPKLTNEILDKLSIDVWEPQKTFCDPACGNGNILIEVFKRKLSYNHAPIQSLSTIYGVDIMEDNIQEMKERFLEIIPEHLHIEAIEIMDKQFICHDALTWDFENWKSTIQKHRKLF